LFSFFNLHFGDREVGEALWYGSVGKRYVPGGERSRELLQFVV
jgi:hypothetical protein